MKSSFDAFHQIDALRKALADSQKAMTGTDADKTKQAADALSKKIDAWRRASQNCAGVGPVNRDLARLIFSVESADMRPADTVKRRFKQNCDALEKDLAQWQQLNQQDVPALISCWREANYLPPVTR